jgi:hypothetical protein
VSLFAMRVERTAPSTSRKSSGSSAMFIATPPASSRGQPQRAPRPRVYRWLNRAPRRAKTVTTLGELIQQDQAAERARLAREREQQIETPPGLGCAPDSAIRSYFSASMGE